MESSTTTYYLNEQPADTLVIHCSDPRFQKAFHSFIKDELGIQSPIPLVLGGSIHHFGARGLFPESFKTLRQHPKFFLDGGKINRVVIINHDDCYWYQEFPRDQVDLPHIFRFSLKVSILGWTEEGGQYGSAAVYSREHSSIGYHPPVPKAIKPQNNLTIALPGLT